MNETPQWSLGTKQLVAATLIILGGLLIYTFRSLIPPLIIAFLISYVLAPVVALFSRRLHIGRVWVTALLYLLAVALIGMMPAIAVPTVVNEVKNLQFDLNDIINRLIAWADQFAGREILVGDFILKVPDLDIPPINFQTIFELLQKTISPIAGSAFSIVMSVASGVGWVLFIAVISFYMIVDAERIGPFIQHLTPAPYRNEIARLGSKINRTWNAFLRGQIVLCTIIGIATWIAMASIGISYSVALGIIAGVLELIPNVGPVLSSVPAILLALFRGSSYLPMSNLSVAILVALIYVVIQNLENNFLVPRIIGTSVNLHPLIVIIGVLAGAILANILGALLAAPILATLRDIISYVYCKLTDVDPFPPPPSFAKRVQERGIRALLFDLDGTLLDSDDMSVERWARRLCPWPWLKRLYSGQRLARKLIMAAETPVNAAITLLDMVGLDNMVLSSGEWLRNVYAQRSPQDYVAVEDAVAMIRQLGPHYALGLVTTRGCDDVNQFLTQFELQDAFQVIVTRQDVKRLKPHPEPVRFAARQLGYRPDQCIMIGDTTVDIRAGQKAGALTVGVLCGFGEQQELERLGPDLIVETTAHLTGYLDQADTVEERQEE